MLIQHDTNLKMFGLELTVYSFQTIFEQNHF